MLKYQDYTIDDQTIRGQKGKTQCPKCAELGKKNYKDKCLSVDKSLQVFHCHKCGWSGYFGEIISKKVEYLTPDIRNFTQLSDEHLIYFSKRGINADVVNRSGIQTAKNDFIAFPYYEGENVVNVKYRKSKDKKFMQAKQAKQTMYKYNDIINQDSIIICEGEFDALAWEMAGYKHATSVSQGAPNANDKTIDKKIECIYNCFDVFENANNIYLSVDTDEELYETAKDVQVEGIFRAADFKDKILSDYRNGQPKGTTTYFSTVDKIWTHRPGEVTIWTGYNNEGKSLFLKQLLLLKSKFEGWKHAIFSPEELPLQEFYTDLIESYIGKSADSKYKNMAMSEVQLNEGINFMDHHFITINPSEDHSIDELLKKFSYVIRKNNVKTVTFDPYNQIHHKMESGEREDLYISRFMAKLKKFAVDHNVSVHLVAHQVTPFTVKNENYPKPNIYKIKGGGTFGDKADNVVIVWRENRNTDIKDTSVNIISQKIKKQKLTGKPGETILDYDYKTNRYLEHNLTPFETNNIDIESLKEEFNIFETQPNPDF